MHQAAHGWAWSGGIDVITREAFMDQFMTEVIDELEQMAYPLISAGVPNVDVEELSLRALNIVRARYGYPPTTERPNLGMNRQERRAQRKGRPA
jgi:hypothetical protein